MATGVLLHNLQIFKHIFSVACRKGTVKRKKLQYKVDLSGKRDMMEGGAVIMLIQFNFKNFKSFREEVAFDSAAAKAERRD